MKTDKKRRDVVWVRQSFILGRENFEFRIVEASLR